METLPDYLDHDLDLVVIGQNPSPASIARQCYYGNPRNRFWPAMRGAGLVPDDFTPDADGFRWLLERERIGFTDVVKKPTPGAGDLRAADFREWAPVLDGHLRHYRPRIAWFNGKGVYQSYLRYGHGVKPDAIELGEQPVTLDPRLRHHKPQTGQRRLQPRSPDRLVPGRCTLTPACERREPRMNTNGHECCRMAAEGVRELR